MIPWFEFHVIRLGFIPIQVWGLCVALGILVVFAILNRESKRLGYNTEMIFGITLRAIIWGFIGSRLAHVFFYYPDYFMKHPLEVFAIWQGGLSSFGGLLGASVSILWDVWYKKRTGSVSLRALGDLMSYSAVFGWIIGRVGCVLIHDHAGQPCPGCFLATPWRDGVMRLDMALLEIIAMLPLAIWFALSYKWTKKFSGWYSAVLFMYYGILRFILDFWRATDIALSDIRYAGLTPGQYFAILLVLSGAWLYTRGKKNETDKNNGRVA